MWSVCLVDVKRVMLLALYSPCYRVQKSLDVASPLRLSLHAAAFSFAAIGGRVDYWLLSLHACMRMVG